MNLRLVLDPRGRDEILAQIEELHNQGMTVVLVSHSMDDVARLTKRLIVMHHSAVVYDDETRKVFSHYESLQEIGLDIPTVTKLMFRLKEKGWSVRQDVLTVEEAKEEILLALKEEKPQLKDITIGQYIPGNSPVHKLDPRTKIIAIVLYMVGLFLVNNFAGYLFVTIFTVGIIFLSQISLVTILKGFKPLLLIIFLTLALHVFMTEGRIIWQWGFLKITWEGLRQGIFMALRLIYLVSITSLLTLTTTPIALTDGLEKVLKAFFVPIAHELAMMMTIALRFIPTLIEETEKIMKAQMARGADFESGGLLSRAKSLIPLLVPLFLSSFRRADDLAMAMEARCYRGGDERTRMKQLVMTSRDYFAFVIIILFLAVSIYSRVW